jgi:hypothetical protein
MGTRDHWQGIYASKGTSEVSWYAPHLRESLRLIQEVAPLDARLVDVGAGASTLVDDLLDLGRAVFHFLTSANDRQAYVQALGRSLVPGGSAVISTFSLAGPAKCSGLDVVRYDADALARELGAELDLTAQAETVHTTPSGNEQRFLVRRFKKRV